MARLLRIEREDMCYHVINRGNTRAWIFHEPADYQGFLARLGRCAERFEIDVLAYVLIYLLWRDGRFRLARIGEYSGIGSPAVSLAKTRAERLVQKDKPLQRRLNITI